jgi:hypothetical protein
MLEADPVIKFFAIKIQYDAVKSNNTGMMAM